MVTRRTVALCLLSLSLMHPLVASSKTNSWATLTGCRLKADPANDGDSFHVRHEGRTYLFRVYFVDCPEISRQVPSRVKQQAEHWGTEEDEVLNRGKDAATFTGQKLRKPFVVHTKWQDAKGQSRMKRHFAFVTTHAGKDLATELVRAGHARAYGASVEHPDGTSARAMWKRLDGLEEEAKEAER